MHFTFRVVWYVSICELRDDPMIPYAIPLDSVSDIHLY
jgi:hypothetical protein